jgi:hypothetical protein
MRGRDNVDMRQFIINMFVGYVCIPQSFIELEAACDNGSDGEVCQRVQELFGQKWFPIVETWNSFKYFTINQQIPPQQQAFADIYQEAETGNYALAFARASCANVKILCKKIAQLRQFRKSLRQWFPKSDRILQARVNMFLITCAIQLLDPRPDTIEPDYCYNSLNADMARIVNDDEIKIKLLSAIICNVQIKIITSITFGRQLVNSARNILNDISFDSELELTNAFASNYAVISKPLSMHDVLQMENMTRIATLRVGTNICFNKIDKKYFVVHGPLSIDDARKYVNICNIARFLLVPRSNDSICIARNMGDETLFIAMHLPYMINLAIMDEPNLLEAIDLMTDPHIILTRINTLRCTLQMGNVFVGAKRAYVLNCLWHFIMNISVCGSVSTDIMVSREGRIFSFNEYPHHANAEYIHGARIAHSDVMDEFMSDIIFYSTITHKWSQKLCELAKIEATAVNSQKWQTRANDTGITAQYLFQCADRATFCPQIWAAFVRSK